MVSTYLQEEAVGYNNPVLCYLGESIKYIGKVDAVYFTKDWMSARGCRIERAVCEAYGVKILEHNFIEEKKEDVFVINTVHLTNKEIDEEDIDKHVPRLDY